MKVLVCGATGCVGSAVANALRSRGHSVVQGARAMRDGAFTMHVDFAHATAPADWAQRLRAGRIDAVVNCVGILVPRRGQTFERVHSQGPIELFRGAELAGVRRVIQVSALGVGREPGNEAGGATMPYLHSKQIADEALRELPLDWAVLRPSLTYGPRSRSAALFATLASLPAIGLPGRGHQPVQPLHVFELAEAVALLVERTGSLRRVFELGGPQAMGYREMLAAYRTALGLGPAWWVPVPMVLMRLGAAMAEALPQQAFCRDTVSLLERGSVPRVNDTAMLLGRAPTALSQGLAVTVPEPSLDLRVQLSPALSAVLRAALAFMWLSSALVTLALPETSGVLRLLARCGLHGDAAWTALIGSCLLNGALGAATWWRPSHTVYLLQLAAVFGYTVTAAVNMPELTLDHCGPLAKNVPVAALALLLAMAQPLKATGRLPGRTSPMQTLTPTAWPHRQRAKPR